MCEQSDYVPTIDKEIEVLLEDIAAEEGIQEFTIATSFGSKKGDGYGGIIVAIKIIGKTAENKNKSIDLIVKAAPKSDALRAATPMAFIYEREIYIYSTVFNIFGLFEAEKGLPQTLFAPKFYKGNLTNKSEALILENLKANGYRLYERRIPMDENHVSLVITEYGRMHALSLALRDQNLEKFQKNIGNMEDLYTKFMKEMGFKNMIIKKCAKAADILDPNSDKEALQIYQKFLSRIDSFFENLFKPVDEYSVVLHGDCWTNNMLFKYNDKNDEAKPTHVRFIDFQGSRLGSPVLDLAYFFYACSSKEIMYNVNDYIQLYYNSLSAHLTKLGSNPNKAFPYTVLQQHWKKYAGFGLMLSILVIQVMLTEENEVIDFSKIAEAEKGIESALNYEIVNLAKYNERVKDIILHFVRNDL